MKIETPLQPDDFSFQALDANAQGQITPKQYGRLYNQAVGLMQPEVTLPTSDELPETTQRLSMLLMSFVALALFGCLFLNSAILRANPAVLVVAVIMCGLMGGVGYRMLRQRRQSASEAARPQRAVNIDEQLKRLQSEDIHIETYAGAVTFSKHSRHRVFWLDTGKHQFPISEALYLTLHPHADKLIVHYMLDPFVALLSVEPAPPPPPPTEEELANVIGIGDDGELIYRDEDDVSGTWRAE